MIRETIIEDKNKIEQLNFLNAYYNTIEIPYLALPSNLITHEALIDIYNEWKKDLPIDGLVIEFNYPKYRYEIIFHGEIIFS